MSKDCALELLSPEVQYQILLHIDCLDTVYAIVCASPRLYQVFRINRETILSTIVLCQFHPAVQPEATAIAKLEQTRRQSNRDAQSQRHAAVSFCEMFPHQIHRWCDTNVSGLVSTDLCRLNGTTKFFVDDYTRNTLPILGQLGNSQDLDILPEYSHTSYTQLSSTETGRLQRAFCRFELYRLLFSRCSQDLLHGFHKCIPLSPVTATEQARLFLQGLPLFQITEIACIRDYLFRRLRGIYDKLENEAVSSLPVEALTFAASDEIAMWRSPFYLFTTHARHRQEDHLEHLVSLGLPYIRRVLESTCDSQRDLFLHYRRGSVVGHLESDFLSRALQCLGINRNGIRDYKPWPYIENHFTPECDGSGYSELPQGWLWGHHKGEPSMMISRVDKHLRDWGYVFWDYERLRKSGILRRG